MNKLKEIWKQRGHVIIAVTIALLFSIGGGGFKPARRLILPLLVALSLPAEYYKRIIFVVWTATILSLGYTPLMDGEQYLKLAGLSVLSSLGYTLLCSWRRYAKIAIVFACIVPISLYANKHMGLAWEYFELFYGSCFAIGYLIARKEHYE